MTEVHHIGGKSGKMFNVRDEKWLGGVSASLVRSHTRFGQEHVEATIIPCQFSFYTSSPQFGTTLSLIAADR